MMMKEEKISLNNNNSFETTFLGDIFENKNDHNSWEANSKYPKEQQKSREMILSEADWIIPGHDGIFKKKLKNT